MPLNRPQKKPQPPSDLGKIKSIVAVASCKGGVGKSTIASMIAYELAKDGHKVGLLDADIFGPSIPTLFGIHKTHIYLDDQKRIIPYEHDSLKIMSFGFLTGDSPAIMRGPIVSNYIQQLIHQTAWGELDYLFIDMPPGTGDIQLTITQTARLTGAIIVTTPHTLSLVDVAKGILMFEKVDVPIIGLVENMSYFECDGCHKQHDIFGTGSKHLADRFGIDIIQKLPIVTNSKKSIFDIFTKEMLESLRNHTLHALDNKEGSKKEIPNVSFDAQNISLSWPDKTTLKIENRTLRLSCGCALCMDEITGKAILKAEGIPEDIRAEEISPLGNYAISIKWSDGHSSGIYPYKNIREIAKTMK